MKAQGILRLSSFRGSRMTFSGMRRMRMASALLCGFVLRLQQQQQPPTRRGNCEDLCFRLRFVRLIMQRQMQGLQVPHPRMAESSTSAFG